MGLIVLVWRLAVRDLRRRLTQSVLLLLVIAAATSTLALAFSLDGTSNHPWSTTRAATAGPDVMLQTYPSEHPDPTQLDALGHAPGVVGTSGPYPMASPVLRAGQITDPVFAEGRGETMSAIDRPRVTRGTWVRPGGVVVERGFADELGVHVGSQITLSSRTFQVVGVAVDTDRGANWRPQLGVGDAALTHCNSPDRTDSSPTCSTFASLTRPVLQHLVPRTTRPTCSLPLGSRSEARTRKRSPWCRSSYL